MPHPVLDDPNSCINWKFTNKPITFRCSINRQHPAQILRVRPLIIGVCWCLIDYVNTLLWT